MSKVLALAIALVVTAGLACEVDPLPGRTPCQQKCAINDDCQPGLVCFDTTSQGPICLPKGCNGCNDSGRACSINGKPQDNGDVLCTFLGCT